jgi:dTDP-glucose 4,6-dehydratase
LALYSKKTKNFIFNISSNEILSINKLVKLICKKMNYNFNNLIKTTSDRVGKDKIYFMNSSKAKSILRWQNDTNLSNGIDKTIIWIQKNFEKIKLLKTNYLHKK